MTGFTIHKVVADLYRINGDFGNLVGLISASKKHPGGYLVEMMMKSELSKECASFEEAVAFVRGAEASMRAFRNIKTKEDSR